MIKRINSKQLEQTIKQFAYAMPKGNSDYDWNEINTINRERIHHQAELKSDIEYHDFLDVDHPVDTSYISTVVLQQVLAMNLRQLLPLLKLKQKGIQVVYKPKQRQMPYVPPMLNPMSDSLINTDTKPEKDRPLTEKERIDIVRSKIILPDLRNHKDDREIAVRKETSRRQAEYLKQIGFENEMMKDKATRIKERQNKHSFWNWFKK